MAEAPPTEPTVLTASKLMLAEVPARTPEKPWVPGLAVLESSKRTKRPAEARAYLGALTRADHGLSYVTVDELVGTVVGLAIDPWPGVDERGRLAFAGEAVVDSLELDVTLLQRFLNTHRSWAADHKVCPSELVREPVRIGDVYGMTVTVTKARLRIAQLVKSDAGLPTLRVPTEHGSGVEFAGLYVGTTQLAVVDIGADARELARTAYYAAMSNELDVRRRADRVIVEEANRAVLKGLAERPGGV